MRKSEDRVIVKVSPIHSDFFHLPVEPQIEYLPLLDDWYVRENLEKAQDLMGEAGL